MANIQCFVVGASAGGLEVLRTMAARLPRDFASIICVVIHIAPNSPGLIPQLLGEVGPLPARHAADGERPEAGTIYVAPPDYHVLIGPGGRFQLTRGPKENGFRPAIDPLFRSAALAFGDAAAGVILSGGLDDGVAGLVAIKACGGGAIVQDPDDAASPSMPRAALRSVTADRKEPADKIAAAMVELAEGFDPVFGRRSDVMKDDLKKEIEYASGNGPHLTEVASLGEPTLLTCPGCHGALVRLRATPPVRFRCHTGHAFTLESLKANVEGRVEDAIWSAIRALEEHALLCDHLADHVSTAGDGARRAALFQEADAARRRSASIRLAATAEAAQVGEDTSSQDVVGAAAGAGRRRLFSGSTEWDRARSID